MDDNKALYALLTSAGLILTLLFAGYYLFTNLFPHSGEIIGVLGAIIGILVGAIIVKLLEPVWQKIEYEVRPLD